MHQAEGRQARQQVLYIVQCINTHTGSFVDKSFLAVYKVFPRPDPLASISTLLSRSIYFFLLGRERNTSGYTLLASVLPNTFSSLSLPSFFSLPSSIRVASVVTAELIEPLLPNI